MPKQSITTLKNWFKRGLKPLENQFADWMDSFWHQDQSIPIDKVSDLENTLNALASNASVQALDTAAEKKANKGVANGYASLDAGGKVPASQLPSYVDDVLEFANLGAFPAIGESGKIFVALDTNLSYRWSGSAYVIVSSVPSDATPTVKGILKLYADLLASNGDGSATQAAIVAALGLKKNIVNDGPAVVSVAGTLTINGVVGSLLTLDCNNREESKFKFVGNTSPLSIDLTNFPEGAYAQLTIERNTNTNIGIRFRDKTYLLSNTQLINNGKDALIVRGRSSGRTVAYLGFYRAAETGAENNEAEPVLTNVVTIMKFTEDTQL